MGGSGQDRRPGEPEGSPVTTPDRRRILLVAHPRRQEAHDLATHVVKRLHAAGIEVVMQPGEAVTLGLTDHPGVRPANAENPAEGCELICVLGGDGTILRGRRDVAGGAGRRCSG